MAIHDATYSSPPRSFEQLRWRLLFLAEERVGHAVRRNASSEDAAFNAAMEAARDR